MKSLKEVLMSRDGLSPFEADDAIDAAREEVMEGYDPEDILRENFGLEPDYVFDLLKGMNAGLGNNVVPIRPTVGMSRLEQLRAFVEWEQKDDQEKTHIAAWALFEIERLRAAIQQTLDENGHLADGDNCTLIALKLALEMPNAGIYRTKKGVKI